MADLSQELFTLQVEQTAHKQLQYKQYVPALPTVETVGFFHIRFILFSDSSISQDSVAARWDLWQVRHK